MQQTWQCFFHGSTEFFEYQLIASVPTQPLRLFGVEFFFIQHIPQVVQRCTNAARLRSIVRLEIFQQRFFHGCVVLVFRRFKEQRQPKFVQLAEIPRCAFPGNSGGMYRHGVQTQGIEQRVAVSVLWSLQAFEHHACADVKMFLRPGHGFFAAEAGRFRVVWHFHPFAAFGKPAFQRRPQGFFQPFLLSAQPQADVQAFFIVVANKKSAGTRFVPDELFEKRPHRTSQKNVGRFQRVKMIGKPFLHTTKVGVWCVVFRVWGFVAFGIFLFNHKVHKGFSQGAQIHDANLLVSFVKTLRASCG